MGKNVFVALNEAGSTLHQLGQNISDNRSETLNDTEETARHVDVRAADVLSNIRSEIKKD